MCLIRVKPEPDDEHQRPPRRAPSRSRTSNSRIASHRNSRVNSRASVIETVKVPPPQPSISSSFVQEPYIVQVAPPHEASEGHSHWRSDDDSIQNDVGPGGGFYGASPRTSIISSHTRGRERDYYVDGSATIAGRSPRSSYRYIDGRSSSQRIESLQVDERARGERYGYNNFHGRRSGSVIYVNPRHSHRSVRSQGGAGGRISREKVILVDTEGGYH